MPLWPFLLHENQHLDNQHGVYEMGDHHERRSGLILAKSGWGSMGEWRISWMTMGMICSRTWVSLVLGQVIELCLKWS